MKKIYLATKNKGKAESARRALESFHITVVHVSIDLPELRLEDLCSIARYKALAAYRQIKKPVLAIDAGLHIDSLGGFPGPFTAYTLKTIGLRGILKLVAGKKRAGEFRNAIAYYDKTLKEPICFESHARGHIAEKPRGRKKPWSWGVSHRVFVPRGQQKTLAEMTRAEYETFQENSDDLFLEKFAKWYVKR